ncbi:MAG: response regulator [Clostridiales bacterium]|jgi:signal transduction histidine kinase|nr:response regulator [Clostridiales bacterium]
MGHRKKAAIKFIRSNLMLLLFVLISVAVALMGLYSAVSVYRSGALVVENTRARLVSVSKDLARLVAAEKLDEFQEADDVELQEYLDIKELLVNFAEEKGVLYAYYLRFYEETDDYKFIVDNDYSEEHVGLDTESIARESAPDKALAGEANCVELSSYSVGWDGLISAYAPVYGNDGKIAAVAGVDIYDDTIKTIYTNNVIMSVLLSVALAGMLAYGIWSIMLYKRKAELADGANVAKSAFLSNMSHEMRTPMNAIVGLCRMASNSDDVGEIKEHLNSISVSSAHLRHVIDDILDLSKIESGKLSLEIISQDFRKELNLVQKIMRPQTDAKKQKFLYEVDPQIPQNLYFDSTHLRQIIVNFMSNAVKFTPEGGEIALTARLAEESAAQGECRVRFGVKDNGIGIDEKYIGKLFKPFEQGDGSVTRKYGGTGLGLTISKQLVELMGGKISLVSALGAGSEFSFICGFKVAPKTAEETEAEEKIDLTGKHILLVEDVEINQLVARDVFEHMGAKVETADDGLQGYEKYCAAPDLYDIIFMDVQMPVMDGYEATKKIRASGIPAAAAVPIIAMTANVFKEDIENALNAGMNAHVGKPFEVEQVESALRKAIK